MFTVPQRPDMSGTVALQRVCGKQPDDYHLSLILSGSKHCYQLDVFYIQYNKSE